MKIPDSKRYGLITILYLSLILSSCKSEKINSNLKSPFKPSFSFIDFGYGGGFAGTYNFYRIKDTGELWKLENDSAVQIINTIPIDSLLEVEMLMDDLTGSVYQSNIMGNMTYFLKIKTNDTLYNYIWKEEADPVETKASILYDKLNYLQKKSLEN